MAYPKNAIKISIGKEGTIGTLDTRDAVLPVDDTPDFDRTIETQDDPMLVGTMVSSGSYPVAADTKGGISLSPRSCAGMGHVFKGLLGTEELSAEVVGVILIQYVGSGATSASCKIVTVAGASKTITASKGALGSESADSDFGTTGVITVGGGTTDTVDKIVAMINGYTNKYTCKKLMGAVGTAATVVNVMACTGLQAKGKYAMVILTGTGSGVYAHRFSPDLSQTERYTYSIQKDGFTASNNGLAYAGCIMDELEMSATLKDRVKGKVQILGMGETAGQTDNATANPTAGPWIFGGGLTTISGIDYVNTQNNKITIRNKHNPDGYGQASIDRAYQQKSVMEIEGEDQFELVSTTSWLERAKIEASTNSSRFYFYKSGDILGTATNLIYAACIIEVGFAENKTFDWKDSNGVYAAGMTFRGTKPTGQYDPSVVITMFSTDSVVYN